MKPCAAPICESDAVRVPPLGKLAAVRRAGVTLWRCLCGLRKRSAAYSPPARAQDLVPAVIVLSYNIVGSHLKLLRLSLNALALFAQTVFYY
jgi:hypothetical protein